MATVFRYTPPKVNAALALAAAAPAAVQAAAEHIRATAEPFVPVDTAKLVGSGRVELDGPTSASVIYDAVAPDGYAYGIRQHEDLSLHHPNGGQAKFLEQPMHTEQATAAGILAEHLRSALKL